NPTRAGLENGLLARGNSQARFNAAVGLKQWKAEPSGPITATVTMRDSDIADFLALAGSNVDVSGRVNADIAISGTVGNPQGTVQLAADRGAIHGEPYDRIQLHADLSDQRVNLTSLEMTAGGARIDGRGTFIHPRDSFTTGRIQASVSSNQVELSQFKTLRPGLSGIVSLNADLLGDLQSNRFEPKAINANVKATGVRDSKQSYGDLTAIASTYGSDVNTRIDSNFAGSKIQVVARTQLKPEYPTMADASIRSLQIEKAVAI